MTTTTQPPSVLTSTDTAFLVEAYEKIDYELRYVDGVFALGNTDLAELYVLGVAA